MLVDRREFAVLGVHDALAAFAQPELLMTEEDTVDVALRRGDRPEMQKVVVPDAQTIPPRWWESAQTEKGQFPLDIEQTFAYHANRCSGSY